MDLYNKLFDRCDAFDLVFEASLPANGPVWEELSRQFVAHCRSKHLYLTGYIDTQEPRGPSEAPFVLLWSSNKGPSTKLKRFKMEAGTLGPATFTASALLATRYTSPPYPWKGEREGVPMIRIGLCVSPPVSTHAHAPLAPRFGDIHGHLGRWQLHRDRQPGLADYNEIESRYSPHACFAQRVWCELIENAQAACGEQCPLAPVAQTANEVLSPEPLSPDVLIVHEGVVEISDHEHFDLDDDDDDSVLSLSAQTSPRTFVRQAREALFLRDDDSTVTASTSSDHQAVIAVDSPLAPTVCPVLWLLACLSLT